LADHAWCSQEDTPARRGGKGQSAINLPSFVSVTAGWQKYPGE
jgi:hypothetical protein